MYVILLKGRKETSTANLGEECDISERPNVILVEQLSRLASHSSQNPLNFMIFQRLEGVLYAFGWG